jgi:HSP20 family protein
MLLEKRMPLPLREFDRMDRRLGRFFEDLGFVPAISPAADIYEAEGELVVELEVPGFDEKELEVEVSDHTLRISGERKEQTEKHEKTMRLRGRLEKAFERRFELPVDIDGEHITANCANGVLTVHVPKTSHATPHKVEITKA